MIQQNSLWSDEINLEIEDKLWLLNKSKLLESLTPLKTVENVKILRTNLIQLVQELKNPQSSFFVMSENDESLELSQNYLLEELQQIIETLTLERALYYLERLEKGLTQIKTTSINDINLNRWKEYDDILTDSLWVVNRRDSSGVHTAGYWGNFIPQIPNQMLKRYTKKGEWVLDTFAGSGTTLIESQRLGRNGLGIELQTHVAEQARQLIATEPNQHQTTSQIVVGDSAMVDYKQILADLGQTSVQLLIMHPPYFDIIKFSQDERDLSNAASVDSFVEMMEKVIDNATPFLDKGRYFALVIGDKFTKGEWIPLGFLTMNAVLKRGFLLKSIIVKNFEETAGKRNQKELWKYRALAGGFYIFKHEYIFLFKKK